MALFTAVHGFQTGEDIKKEILNRPIYELVERTNYLYDQVQNIQSGGLFQTVRIIDAPMTSTGSAAPVVGDFVFLDPDIDTYSKALADTVATDSFATGNSSYTVGLLTSITNGIGTVIFYGKEDLKTASSAWLLSDLMETGETFRNGPYYLSAVDSGKITANPSGPKIYLGFFMEDPDNLGYGGSVILNPQYSDLLDAHQHRAYALTAQPAGTQYVSGSMPTDTHAVRGFDTVAAGDPADHIPRLVAFGSWAGTEATQYTIWLSNSNDPDEVLGATVAPADWGDYIHWSSDDAVEGTGVARIWSYESPVVVGTKGLTIALENPTDADWDEPYNIVLPNVDAEDKRTWIITVPTQTKGWLANKQRKYFDDHFITDQKYSFLLLGGPHTGDDDRINETITVKCGKLYRLAYTGLPADGDILTIGAITFEFNGVTPGYTAVTIAATSDATYINLLDAIIAQGITGVDVALGETTNYLMLTVPAAVVPVESIANATLASISAGAGDLAVGVGSAVFLVYDKYHRTLVATTSYWNAAEFWSPQALNNGLSIMAVPYDTDGAAAIGTLAAVGDYFDVDLSSEAPSANFVYSMGMHQALSQYFPPIPAEAASLVLNGVELDAYSLFPTDPTYRQGMTSLYWYSNAYGNVPWPRDWESIAVPGSSEYMQNMLFHFVRMTVGNTGVVTSLAPAPGSPIKVTQCGTSEVAGRVGDLELDLDLELTEEDASLTGYKVVKEIKGKQLRKGPVVEKIISDGTVTIISESGAPAGQGVVKLSLGSGLYGGDFQEIVLENGKAETIGMFSYIKLMPWTTGGSANIPSAFTAKFHVPYNVDGDYRVVIYATVFGEADVPYILGGAKQYAAIDFTYSILPDFTSMPDTPSDFPLGKAWNSLGQTLPTGLLESNAITAEIPLGKYDEPQKGSNPIYMAYDPMLIHNNPDLADEERRSAQVLGNPFPVKDDLKIWTYVDAPVVRSGSLIGIRVARANLVGGGDEYTSGIGFINLRWQLSKI